MMQMAPADVHPQLNAALLDPRAYPHEVSDIHVIETHISWVILTGHYAYKIKKPVNLGFLDFSTLDARHHYCEEEIRINVRLAPRLYLDVVPVVPVVTNGQQLRIAGDGEPIEFAVRMKQFPHEARLDRAMAGDRVEPRHIDQLADTFAAFHTGVDAADVDSAFGRSGELCNRVSQSIDTLRNDAPPSLDGEELDRITQWFDAQQARTLDRIDERRGEGFVREGHGDAHLENLALIDDVVVPFDAIEFDPALRWIDVMNDIAYPLMDLESHGRPDLAARLLNRYLERTGDYRGVPLLRYMKAYRALVRAMVACLKGASDDDPHPWRRYLTFLRSARSTTARPLLLIAHGPSGVGKTTLTQQVVERFSAIRVRTDVERKRMFGLPVEAPIPIDLRQRAYGRDASQRVYYELHQVAQCLLANSVTTVLDGTYLHRAHRDAARAVAHQCGARAVIIDFRAGEEALRERIRKRKQTPNASDADEAVLRTQLRSGEPLDSGEEAHAIVIDTQTPDPAGQLCERIERLGRTSQDRGETA